ncbi:MAG: hypothetical protein K6T86_09665 [Pirellulales bacterium]|nr:hypothetical protein [Pirellulales bacterium]
MTGLNSPTDWTRSRPETALCQGQGCVPPSLMLALLAVACMVRATGGQELLPGEFGRIDLGRTLLEPSRFPTIRELRALAGKEQITAVVMLKLFSDGNNNYLPVWSQDGQRLAFQQSDLKTRSSRLLVFQSLAQQAPDALAGPEGSRDVMFRWGIHAPGSFVFSRMAAQGGGRRVYFAAAGHEGKPCSTAAGGALFPSLYRRTDGIWRLVYEADGQIWHEAWNDDGPADTPRSLVPGSAPRWASDGQRLVFVQVASAGGHPQVALLYLAKNEAMPLPTPPAAAVRSPTWSPDEKRVAFYFRSRGEGQPWQIHVCSLEPAPQGVTLASGVIANPDFDSEGPSWEPSGARIWCFSNTHRRQAYYPLVAFPAAGGQPLVVDYPARCTTPTDLAVNPVNTVPELAIAAHDGLPLDLYILFLNHY